MIKTIETKVCDVYKREQNLTVPRMLCDKCKLVIPIGAMYAVSDLGRTFCSDCYKEIEKYILGYKMN